MLGPGRYDKKKLEYFPSGTHIPIAGMEPDSANLLLEKVLSVLRWLEYESENARLEKNNNNF